MPLRPYQLAAIDGARAQLRAGHRAVLLVMPTGTGKTVVFAETIRLAVEKGGKALVLAHRTELLAQARQKLRTVAPDLRVELEQASARASSAANVVVASVQSLRGPRLQRWAQDAFSLVIVDEAHHATAATYRAILEHFAAARVLGVTATPDRADERGLGEVFGAVGYELSMQSAIAQGYLVPLRMRTATIKALDLDGVKVRGGDFVERDLNEALSPDEVQGEIARRLPELAGERPTVVFCAGVENAYRLARLLGERTKGCAVALDGTSDPVERAATLLRFSRGDFQFLVNVGLFTEGFDAPRVACVAIARPTQSRALMCQMVGRGTRPLAGVVDAHADDAARVAAIASSTKPDLLVLNFEPVNSQHRLVTPVDVLGVTDPSVRACAEELLEQSPELDVSTAIERAAQDERVKRTMRLAREYELLVVEWDPFRLELDLEVARDVDARTIAGGDPTHDIELLREQLVDAGVSRRRVALLSVGQAVALQRALAQRKRRGLCSLKQATWLHRFGLNPNVSRADGGRAMELLRACHWRICPPQLRTDPVFALAVPQAQESAAE